MDPLTPISKILIGIAAVGWILAAVFSVLYIVGTFTQNSKQNSQDSEDSQDSQDSGPIQPYPECPACPECVCEVFPCPEPSAILYETPYYLMSGSQFLTASSTAPSASTTSKSQVIFRGSDGQVKSGAVQEGDKVLLRDVDSGSYISRTGSAMYKQPNAKYATGFQFSGEDGDLQLGTEYSWLEAGSTAGYAVNSNNSIVYTNSPGKWRFTSTYCP